MGVAQAVHAGLTGLVHVVVLNLAEVPVVGIHQLLEHRGAAVVGEADVPDLARGQLVRDPLPDAQLVQLLPGGRVREHVHQVVVDMVRLQPPQLLLEGPFHAVQGLYHIVGQLGRQIDPVPAVIAAEDFPHRRLAAGVDVGRVQIVDPAADGGQQLLFGLVKVDGVSFSREAHTAIAQEGDGIAFFVLTVLHR